MDARLCIRVTHHADCFARSFARAGVRRGTLAANRQPAEMTDAPVTFDALEALEVHTEFALKVALDDVTAFLNRVHNLGDLLLGKVFCPDSRVDFRLRKDVLRIARADAIDI